MESASQRVGLRAQSSGKTTVGAVLVLAFALISVGAWWWFKVERPGRAKQEATRAEAALLASNTALQENQIGLAKAWVEARLKDPTSAQYRSLRVIHAVDKGTSKGYIVCGEVNAKNAFGGYVGFRLFYWYSQAESMEDPDLIRQIEAEENRALVVANFQNFCVS